MRVVAIAALSLLASLAFVPTTSAEPVPPRCDDSHIVGGLSLNEDCGLTAEYRLMSCPLSGSWKEYHVGNNVVRLYTCDTP